MVDRLEKLVAEAKKHITEISPTQAAAKMKSGRTNYLKGEDIYPYHITVSSAQARQRFLE
jgi:hypothetical protein